MADENIVMLALGLLIAITASATFGVTNLEVLDSTIQYANWVFIGGFIAVYLISDRQINALSDFEAVGFVIPIVAALAYEFVPQVTSFVDNNSPYAGIVLFLLTFAGFYALSSNLSLQAVVSELSLGSILLLSALTQFNIISIELFNGFALQDFSTFIFVIGLGLAYFISQRDIRDMKETELIAIAIGVGTYLGYEYIPQVETFITANNPLSGIVAVAFVLIAYFYISQNGDVIPEL